MVAQNSSQAYEFGFRRGAVSLHLRFAADITQQGGKSGIRFLYVLQYSRVYLQPQNLYVTGAFFHDLYIFYKLAHNAKPSNILHRFNLMHRDVFTLCLF